MKHLARFAFVAALAAPTLAADTKITTSLHTDASTMMMQSIPAKDSTRITWFGKDRMRIEEDDKVTIVRTDLKKMFVLHPADKTFSALDLPIDMKKLLPPDVAPMMEPMMASAKVTLTPTTETKKVKEWNATKHTMTVTMDMMGMPMTIKSDVWVSKDVTIDRAAYGELNGAMMSMLPGGTAMIAEFKKLDGFPVLMEKTVSMMGNDTKSKEEITAIEAKDAPADAYDVPKDFKEKPFDLMTDNPNGSMGPGGGRARGPGGAGPGGPPKKPVEPPK